MENLRIGDNIQIKDTNIYGVITDIKYKRNECICYVYANGKNITISCDKLQKSDNKILKEKQNRTKVNFYDISNTFIPELMIRHQTLDIAMYNVENFLNEALINKVYEIKIIHGRNGGILRRAVHEYLKHNKNVESFRLGSYYEGSYGVTFIKLKQQL